MRVSFLFIFTQVYKYKKKTHCLKAITGLFQRSVKVLCESTIEFYHRLFYSYVLAILLTSQVFSVIYLWTIYYYYNNQPLIQINLIEGVLFNINVYLLYLYL